MTDDQIRWRSPMTPTADPCRRASLQSLVLLMTLALGACQPSTPPQDKIMNQGGEEIVHFNISAISYIERPIFAVKLNDVEIGAGGGSLVTGVSVPLGPQVLTWRDGETGESFAAANQPVLARPDPKLKYLGIHIYPDSTVELKPEPYWPEKTERGEAILRTQETKHGP